MDVDFEQASEDFNNRMTQDLKEGKSDFVPLGGIPEGFVPLDFIMNPATDDLIFGYDLKEGMVVLLESLSAREDPKRLEDVNVHPYTKNRIFENARWCLVTRITTMRGAYDVHSFIGLYADGTKMSRTFNRSFAWIVKK